MNRITHKLHTTSPFSRGFTLIELLVVISIVALLISVTMAAVQLAKKNSQDINVISTVRQAQTQLESNYINGVYPNLDSSGNPVSTQSGYSGLMALQASAAKNGGTGLTYAVTTNSANKVTAYAVYGQLISNKTLYFCRDSVGGTSKTATSPSSATCSGGSAPLAVTVSADGVTYSGAVTISWADPVTLYWKATGTIGSNPCTFDDSTSLGTGIPSGLGPQPANGSALLGGIPGSDTITVTCSAGARAVTATIDIQ